MFRITRDVFHPVFHSRYTEIFPGHADILNFSSLYPMYRDLAFIWTNIFYRCNGNSVITTRSGEMSQFRYKHNCEDNSKLSTNLDPGIPKERKGDPKKQSTRVNKQRKKILVYC